MQVFAAGQGTVAQFVQGAFHRVERIALAGKDAEFHQLVPRFGQRTVALHLQHFSVAVQLADHHAILGQRPGLVGAQHGGRTQGFDRIETPRQYMAPRDTPCPERHEHRQNHRELFRKRSHRQTDAGQQRIQPVTSRNTIHEHQQNTECTSVYRQTAHQPVGLKA